MICLRCGYCCIRLDIMILNPKAIMPDGTLDPCHPEPVISKSQGASCPHLEFVEGKAACKIHSHPCYRETPCDQFEQFGRSEDICTLGSYFKASGELCGCGGPQGQ